VIPSPISGWRRLRREVLRLVIVLLLLEIVVRVDPVKSLLSNALDPYENLLWYADIMPAYQDQLQHGPHFNVWLAGSSYMMTGLQPEWVQSQLAAEGEDGLTVQNYGMTDMRNLYDMAAVYDRWMLPMDQPDYLIIGISVFNFSTTADATARNSPMERTFIFPDSVDDYAAGWLFQSSALFRYALLARNATFIPRDEALLKPHPLGGYIAGPNAFENCNPNEWKAPDAPQDPYPAEVFAPLDRFLEVAQSRQIPVMVVDIPLQYCNMRRFFSSREAYESNYIQPVMTHLQEKGIPFLELATPFYAEVPLDEQRLYFMDRHHPNSEGARLFSQWTGEFATNWLKTLSE
jgi:hypothetical protein